MALILRPLDPADVHALLQIVRSANGAYRGASSATSLRSLDRFLNDAVLDQMVLSEPDSGRPVGLIQCLVPNFRHGTAQLAAVIARDLQGLGWPLVPFAQFVQMLFDDHPLRKLYLEVPSPNVAIFGRGLERIFRREGTLFDHEWLNGGYVDVTFYSITRQEFEDHRITKTLLRRTS